VKQLRTRAKLL